MRAREVETDRESKDKGEREREGREENWAFFLFVRFNINLLKKK